MNLAGVFFAFSLVSVANASPVMLRWLLGTRGAWPLDFGVLLADGRPLFGSSKTIRGIIVGVVSAALLAPVVGLSIATGVVTGLWAMAGDLLSSFTKRRLGLKSSARATGLDQIPESLLPSVWLMQPLDLGVMDVAAVVGLFFFGNATLSPLLHRLGIRSRPY